MINRPIDQPTWWCRVHHFNDKTIKIYDEIVKLSGESIKEIDLRFAICSTRSLALCSKSPHLACIVSCSCCWRGRLSQRDEETKQKRKTACIKEGEHFVTGGFKKKKKKIKMRRKFWLAHFSKLPDFRNLR